MRGSLGGFLEIDALGTRISIDERINQNDGLIRFNAIGCMAQPGDFHCVSPCGSIFSFKTDITAQFHQAI
jgi:hypothetical protein